MKNYIFAGLIIILLVSFTRMDKKMTRVFLAGDSTISIKEKRVSPETGWGMPFAHFFDSSVVIENRAKNGRSTRTFIEEGLWGKLIKDVSAGDYVFIQFGHNDESPEKTDRYTSPEQYEKNISRFIYETRQKKAFPVLLTPVSRRRFKEGKQVETHEVYSQLVRKIADEQKLPMIDLDRKSQQLYQQMGEETSKLLFLQLAPGEHPNYPEGKTDNTHFNELGARLIAQLVLTDLRLILPGLAEKIVKPVKKT